MGDNGLSFDNITEFKEDKTIINKNTNQIKVLSAKNNNLVVSDKKCADFIDVDSNVKDGNFNKLSSKIDSLYEYINNSCENMLSQFKIVLEDTLFRKQEQDNAKILDNKLYKAKLIFKGNISYDFEYIDSYETLDTLLIVLPLNEFKLDIGVVDEVSINYYSEEYKSDKTFDKATIPVPLIKLNKINMAFLLIIKK